MEQKGMDKPRRGRPRKEGSTKEWKQASPPIKVQAGQSVEEMVEQMQAAKSGNKMYRAKNYKDISEEYKAQNFENAITAQMSALERMKVRGRVNLNDLAEVREATTSYLEACKESGIFPSFAGLSASMGMSRNALYEYIRKNDNEITAYLDTFRSGCIAVLIQMGLNRQYAESFGIFILKNMGLTDKSEVEIVARQDPLGTIEDEEILKKRILESVESYATDDYLVDDAEDSEGY